MENVRLEVISVIRRKVAFIGTSDKLISSVHYYVRAW